jgi:methyl-accepting chemotaxis protein
VDLVNEDILLSVSNTDNVDHLKNIHRNIEHFEKDLQKQEGNITEAGEKELVGSLRENFNRYRLTLVPLKTNRMEMYSKTQRPLYNKIKSDLFNISHINMQAILVKNEQVSASVTNFYIWLSIIVTIFFLVSFSFIFNFPHYIAGPIEEFTASIKNFTRNNYQTRLHYELNDEFKELANAFNAMAERIEGYTTKKTKINLKKRKPARSRKKKSG